MSDSPEHEGQSLKELWATAISQKLSIAAQQYNTPEWTTAYSSAVSSFTACQSLISNISLFSSNESLDDIPTTNLPFLSLTYHLADLTLKTPFTSAPARLPIVRTARDQFASFLSQLESYDLLSVPATEALLRYSDADTEKARDSWHLIDARDPAARRDAKIAGFQAERTLKQQLATLRANPNYLENGGDEDIVRDVYMKELELQAHDALQQIDSINTELEVLESAPVRPMPMAEPTAGGLGDNRARRTGSGKPEVDYSDRLDAPLGRNPGGPLLSTAGKPLQPFTLVGNRQDLKKGVFRPGHNLPTMSIDEYLEDEKQRGNIIEGGGEASYARPEPDEDNIEKADEETVKARKWDDYKDDNAKGSGNTINRG